MPDVRGDTIAHATAYLKAFGLAVEVQHVRGGNGDVVLDQDPAPGTAVPGGSVVTLIAF
jgi:beta-lactam-binding protein with PASTA domain